jgi:hypothetical protein
MPNGCPFYAPYFFSSVLFIYVYLVQVLFVFMLSINKRIPIEYTNDTNNTKM